MEEATIDVTNLAQRHEEQPLKKNINSDTVTICKKALVIPESTMVVDIGDIIYYNENKNNFENKKKSPYLIYLSTEFKSAMKKRKNIRNLKIIFVVGMSILVVAFILFMLRFFKIL